MKVTTGSSPLKPVNRIATDHKTEFLKETRGAARPQSGSRLEQNGLISKKQIQELSQALKHGTIDQEEASRRFIDTIAHNSLHDKLSLKDRQKLVDDISEFFKDDPSFLKSLQKNLLALS